MVTPIPKTLTVSPNREKNAIVCCSAGAKVVIHANHYDDHRLVPKDDPEEKAPNVVQVVCDFFNSRRKEAREAEMAAFKVEQNKRAHAALAQHLEKKVGPDLAQALLLGHEWHEKNGPLKGKDYRIILGKAEQHQMEALVQKFLLSQGEESKEESNDANAVIAAPITAEEVIAPVEVKKKHKGHLHWIKSKHHDKKQEGNTMPSNVTRRMTLTKTVSVSKSIGEGELEKKPFNKEVIAARLERSTQATPEQIREILKRVEEKVRNMATVETTTIREVMVEEVARRRIPIFPVDHHKLLTNHLPHKIESLQMAKEEEETKK